MNKYIIEGGIDFYAELYKSLDIEECNEKTEEDNNICLITNLPLTDKFISLNCGHKFNYIPLYHDILNHKKHFNYLEGSGKLTNNEIRCPYCRKKHNGLLPYYKELDLERVNGVNYYNPNVKQSCSLNKCEYELINPKFDPDIPVSDTNQKTIACCNGFTSKISIYNPLDPLNFINYGDNKKYCQEHKKIMIKKYKEEEREKVKAAKKLMKDQEKLEKQKIKEEKKLLKKKLKDTNTNENIVLGTTSTELACQYILKRGINKGSCCGNKIFLNNLCKRHSNDNVVAT